MDNNIQLLKKVLEDTHPDLVIRLLHVGEGVRMDITGYEGEFVLDGGNSSIWSTSYDSMGRPLDSDEQLEELSQYMLHHLAVEGLKAILSKESNNPPANLKKGL